MFLYNFTLQGASQVTGQIVGHFSGTKHQEVLVAHHDRLELYKPDSTTGKLESLLATPSVFGVIRAIAPFRLTGATKDHIIIASDSGRIVILEYDPAENALLKVHQETYGKSGCRRVVPGQYLATDPKGRAAMIGAVEKQKLVYILNRDAAANLTISSPLEAHKAHTLLFHTVGLDVGFDNPVFACLELDYTEVDLDPSGEALEMAEKVLTYYELDLGLNHVVRKWSDPVDARANMLVAVPGGTDGPSGVLVCSENFITYRHQDAPEHCVPIPRRRAPGQDTDRGLLIVGAALHKMKNAFFILLQSEDGDVFKVTIDHENSSVNRIYIKYFDTLPVAIGLSILKSGFMVVSPEAGNPSMFQFIGLGNDDETELSSDDFGEGLTDPSEPVYFQPRALTNLQQTDEIESISPCIDARIMDLANEDSPQIYALCGKGSASTFRILRHGLEVTEVGEMQLPGRPTAVWTTRLGPNDDTGVYVVSFVNATLVLTMSESPEEVSDSGISTTTQTLALQQLGDEGVVQVHPHGLRHIRTGGRVNEWRPPKEKTILTAATNARQVILALTGGELVYFELDAHAQLAELSNRAVMAAQVTSLCLGGVPAGRVRFPFAIVGCADNTVRTLSLDPSSPMQPLSMQAVAETPVALHTVEMPNPDLPASSMGSLYLHIGLTNGVMLRTVMDHVTGVLSDTRSRFLGSRPVKLHGVTIQGEPAVLALSSRPWFCYTRQSRTRTMPLSYEALEYASSFATEQWPDGIVAITGDCLKLLAVEKLDATFNQASVPLRYTPRRHVIHPTSNHFVIIETENNTYSLKTIARLTAEGDAGALSLDPAVFGLTKAQAGKWASLIRVLNPFTGETTNEIELDENEAAFSLALCTFQGQAGELFVVVGTAVDAVLAPRSCSAAYLRVYKFNPEGTELELMHRTLIDDIPMAVLGFKGRLLAGVGRLLRIYAYGKMKLLRKCQCKQIPSMVVSLFAQGDRIVVGDVQESVHYVAYSGPDNQLVVFADDTLPAWTSAVCQVDHDTTALGDKFGNVFIIRLPADVVSELEGDPSEGPVKSLIHRLPPNNKGSLNGAPYKLARLVTFHVGDTITSIQRVALVRGGREILVYMTILGAIGVLVPFLAKDDVEFFQTLEFHLRGVLPPLLGRDHLSYRSHYFPINAAVDGDLCELYHRLAPSQRQQIADELGRTPQEVAKKIDDMRTLVAF